MPLVAGDNRSFSPGRVCDLIFVDTALAAGTIGAWTGPSGGWTTFALATIFDVRQYTALHITLGATAVTGAGTQTASILAIIMDGPDASACQGPQITVTPTIGSGGGVVELMTGTPSTTIVGASLNVSVAQTPHRLRFLKVGIVGANSPTGFTNGRLHIWGYR